MDFSGTAETYEHQVNHKFDKERSNLNVTDYWAHSRKPYAKFIKLTDNQAAKTSPAQEAYNMITKIIASK